MDRDAEAEAIARLYLTDAGQPEAALVDLAKDLIVLRDELETVKPYVEHAVSAGYVRKKLRDKRS